MCTFTRLEVDSDGNLTQSGHKVPSSGFLPRPQNTDPDPAKAQLYAENLFPVSVLVSIVEVDGVQKIYSVYVPQPDRFSPMYLIPLALVSLLIVGLTYLAVLDTDLSATVEVAVISILAALGIYTLGIPAFFWTRGIYYQKGPMPAARKKMLQRYPDLVFHRTYAGFVLDSTAHK